MRFSSLGLITICCAFLNGINSSILSPFNDLHSRVRREAPLSCAFLSMPSGRVSSQDHPNKYENEINWCVVINIKERLTISFSNTFDVESEYSNDDCMYDYVEIRQQYGSTANPRGVLVGKYCGFKPPPIQTLEGPLYIEFKTDHVINGYGWMLDWVVAKEDVGRILDDGRTRICNIRTEDSGIIMSENYPDYYPNNLDICFVIQTNDTIQITWDREFLVDNTGGGDNCEADYLVIYEKSTTADPEMRMGRYCSSNPPGPIKMQGPAFIDFHTNRMMKEKGWRLLYNIIQNESPPPLTRCRTFKDDTGVIESKNYPDYYPTNQDECYIIEADERVTLRFDSDFNMEGEYYHGMCKYDYLQIKQKYSSTNLNDVYGTYCGDTSPGIFDVFGPVMLSHHSDWVIAGKGWRLTYVTDSYNPLPLDPLPTCRYVRGDHGSLTSTNYPRGYSINLNRCYVINTPEVVTIQWNRLFDIDGENGKCQGDFVQVYERYSNSNNDDIKGTYCGQTAPSIMDVRGPVMIREITDRRDSGKGWRLLWQTASYGNGPSLDFPDIGRCRKMDSRSGTISSNYYPRDYPANQDWCRYFEGKYIEITFMDNFELQDSRDCTSDYVEIISESMQNRYCGREKPRNTRYRGPAVIHFRSDMTGTGSGFRLSFNIHE